MLQVDTETFLEDVRKSQIVPDACLLCENWNGNVNPFLFPTREYDPTQKLPFLLRYAARPNNDLSTRNSTRNKTFSFLPRDAMLARY